MNRENLQFAADEEAWALSPLLASKISAVKRKHTVVSVVTGLALALAAVLFILGVTMILDWMFELPYPARAAILAINLLLAGYLIVRFMVLPIFLGPDDDRVGLWIEAREPSFGSRLISTIQLSRPAAAEEGFSRSMFLALARQTETLAQPLDFSRVVSTDSMARSLTIAAAIAVLALVGLAAGGAVAGDLLQRAVLVPGVEVPRKTRVIVDEGNQVVARGDDLTLTARAEGIIPDSGEIRIRYDSGRMQTVPISPLETGIARFGRTLQNLQESFTYQIYLNDGHSADRRVTVAPRPAVADLSIEQIPPEYTGLGRMPRAPGDLSILEGSRLVLRVRASKPLPRAEWPEQALHCLHFHGSDVRYPLIHESDDPAGLIAVDGDQKSVPVVASPEATTGFSIHMVDELGLTSKDPTVYRIDLLPDQAPTVRVTHPLRREELVTQKATLIVGFDAADDFALGAARLRYHIRMPEEQRQDIHGLSATYFGNEALEGEGVRLVDPQVDFQWAHQTSPAPGIKQEYFSGRWEGVLVPPHTDTYTFLVHADDGARLWVDGKPLIDDWKAAQNEKSEPIKLEAGKPYDLRLEFRQGHGGAELHLRWRSEQVSEQIIPREALFISREAWNGAQNREDAIELNLGGQPRSFRGYYEWRIDSITPTPPIGATIEWWLEVEDTNDQTGPGVATSEHYVARVVTPEQKRSELMVRLGEAWNPLGSLTDRQEEISQDLGRMILEATRGSREGNEE